EPHGKARSDPGSGDQPLVSGRQRRRVSGAMRRVLRSRPREDGVPRYRRAARQLRRMARRPARFRPDSGRLSDAPRSGSLSLRHLRHVPHDPRHSRRQPHGARAHAPGQPAYDCGRHPAQSARPSRRVDRRSPADQAGRSHAAERSRASGSGRPARLPREPGMSSPEDAELLHRSWRGSPGLRGWLTSTDHKSIGLRYIVTAFAFFLLGGIEAALMRIQLARPENAFIGPDLYNQLFTVHGSTMMFLFAVPMVTALGIYFV